MTLFKLDFSLSLSSICLCQPRYLSLILSWAAFLNSHSDKEATMCTVKQNARPVGVRRCTASDGGALYNRASVFTASLWVSVGCNINSTTQLYYPQANEHSLVCDHLAQTHHIPIVESKHAHTCANTAGRHMASLCLWSLAVVRV